MALFTASRKFLGEVRETSAINVHGLPVLMRKNPQSHHPVHLPAVLIFNSW
jgi:hypothetical protein